MKANSFRNFYKTVFHNFGRHWEGTGGDNKSQSVCEMTWENTILVSQNDFIQVRLYKVNNCVWGSLPDCALLQWIKSHIHNKNSVNFNQSGQKFD